MIAIVDYGMGNLRSVYNAFEMLGEKAVIISEPSGLAEASAVVVPGVGAFGDAIANLRSSGFADALEREVLKNKKPYLGICLGLQFLASEGYEHGIHKGLGWVKGAVKRIEPEDAGIKIPHMGWNELGKVSDTVLFRGLGSSPVFYFVHSYALVLEEAEHAITTSICWHGCEIIASIRKGNIFATQFHPEKSQKAGLRLLKNFIDFTRHETQNAGDD